MIVCMKATTTTKMVERERVRREASRPAWAKAVAAQAKPALTREPVVGEWADHRDGCRCAMCRE
jgi:hypothetical protein